MPETANSEKKFKIGGIMKVIVIGGVSAGMAAASKLRREIPDAVIEVCRQGPEAPTAPAVSLLFKRRNPRPESFESPHCGRIQKQI